MFLFFSFFSCNVEISGDGENGYNTNCSSSTIYQFKVQEHEAYFVVDAAIAISLKWNLAAEKKAFLFFFSISLWLFENQTSD